MTIQDGKAGQTYLVDVPIDGDPHCHIHNAMWNVVVTQIRPGRLARHRAAAHPRA